MILHSHMVHLHVGTKKMGMLYMSWYGTVSGDVFVLVLYLVLPVLLLHTGSHFLAINKMNTCFILWYSSLFKEIRIITLLFYTCQVSWKLVCVVCFSCLKAASERIEDWYEWHDIFSGLLFFFWTTRCIFSQPWPWCWLWTEIVFVIRFKWPTRFPLLASPKLDEVIDFKAIVARLQATRGAFGMLLELELE